MSSKQIGCAKYYSIINSSTMFPTLDHNDVFILGKLRSEFIGIIHDMDVNRSRNPINKGFQKRITSNFRGVASIMAAFNKKSCLTLSIKTHLLKIMKSMLLIVKVLILITFCLSIGYHFILDRKSHNCEISKKYFSKVSITDGSGDLYITNYKRYRYLIKTLSSKHMDPVVFAIHIMLDGMYAIVGDLSLSNVSLCNLQKYPTLLEHIDTAPDSYFSMVLLSINTFLWMTYMVLIRERLFLERLISNRRATYIQMTCIAMLLKGIATKDIYDSSLEVVSKIIRQNSISPLITSDDTLKKILPENSYIEMCNLVRSNTSSQFFSQRTLNLTLLGMLLLNILGVYASKTTNIGLDNIWIRLWDVTKIVMIYTFQFIYST